MSDDTFKSALERARAVAAKLSNHQGSAPGPGQGMMDPSNNILQAPKRPIDDDDSIVGSLKKMAYSGSSNSNGNGHMARERSLNGNTLFKPTQVYLDGFVQGGEKTLDVMIPGNKVGFVIGKGGEMIRQLQDRAGVKMTVIQQSSEVSDNQKQLRIVGEPSKVDYGKELVLDLLTDKEHEMPKQFKPRPLGEYGVPLNMVELPISPQYIGLVIGKGGENIKRISNETGAKLQVDTTKIDAQGNKICQISGANPNAVDLAARMVREVLDNAMNGRGSYGQNSFNRGEEVKVQVPPTKTGIVIGKGGETVKALKQQCGCNIELEKNSKGIFIIRGPAERIAYAQQLISEKVESPLTVLSSTMDNQQPETAAYDNYWAQSQYAGYAQDPAKAAAAAPDTGNSQDPNAAAWAAYYAQYYANQSQIPQAGAAASAAPSTVPTSAPGVPQGAGQSPANGAQSAQGQDYSAQWAEYYRFYGMEKEAEMIEQMAKKK